MPVLFVLVLIVALVVWLILPRARRPGPGPDDEIEPVDQEELAAAEEEVRDLGATQRPEDGWEGDDWGPGTARKA